MITIFLFTITTTTSTNNNLNNNNHYLFIDSLGSREDVLWTIGWDQLVREERHKLCVNLATDRMETIAGKYLPPRCNCRNNPFLFLFCD